MGTSRIRQSACLVLAGLLLGLFCGCQSARARYDQLASRQIAQVDEAVRREGRSAADDGIKKLSAFELRLPPHPVLDPVRSKVLVKRGELYVLKGLIDQARTDFQRARELADPNRNTLAPTVPTAEQVARRLKQGLVLVPQHRAEVRPDRVRSVAPAPKVEIEAGLWGSLPLRGRLVRDTSVIESTEIDTINDLGMSTVTGTPTLSGAIRLSRLLQFRAELEWTRLTGEAELLEKVRYDGASFPVGDKVRSRCDMLSAGGVLRARVAERRGFRLFLESGFRYTNVLVDLKSPTTRKLDRIDAFLPLLGMSLERELPQQDLSVHFHARACGVYWPQEDASASTVLVDLRLEINYVIFPGLSMRVGGRVEYMRYDFTRDDQDKACHALLAGPFFGLHYRL